MLVPGNPITSQFPFNVKPKDEIYEDMADAGEYVPSLDPGLYGDSSSTKTKLSDYNGDWRSYLQDLVDKGDSAAADKLINYWMSEESADKARYWTASREDTQYQRLVDDLKAAGINPYALMSSAGSPVSSGSNGNSYGGSQWTTKNAQEESVRHNRSSESLKILTTILMVAGMIFAAAL